MKKKQNQSEHQSLRSLFSAKAFRRGSYSAVLCVVVIAIAVVLSLLVSMLPDDVKLIDLTGDSIYQLGDTTRGVLDGLTPVSYTHLHLGGDFPILVVTAHTKQERSYLELGAADRCV